MQLAQYLTVRKETDEAFAQRFREKFAVSCARGTVQQWRSGTRIPAAVDKDRIAELTGEMVTLKDWHEAELKGARSRSRERAA